MQSYRLSKYNPAYRDCGVYRKEEWTSISDVGEVFDGVTFSMEAYLDAEQRYIGALMQIANEKQAFPLWISDLEKGEETCWIEGQRLDERACACLVRDCLRELCWCRLNGQAFYIHFGYDYCVYLGCEILPDEMKQIAECFGLFAEEMQSPYEKENDSE